MLGACGDKKKPTVTNSPKPPEPWSVVCDNAGHYTFVYESGSLWDLQEWDNYDAAVDYALRIKRQHEWDKAHPSLLREDPERDALRRRINSRDWQNCPTPKETP